MKLFFLRLALLALFPFGVLMMLSDCPDKFDDWLRDFKDLWKGDIDDHTDGIEL